jgi:hypothetical protein
MDEDTANDLTMTPREMRRLAAQATEVLVERIGGLDHAKAWDGEFRGVLEGRLGGPPPEAGQPADEVLELAVGHALRYAARLDHPRFFGFVPSSPTWPGVVADFLASGFNINSCTWLVSSGTSQLELAVTGWMREWIGYPETGGGLLTSGGSSASVEAMVAAREAAGHPERPTAYMSDQSHSALKRAALIAGATAPPGCGPSPCAPTRERPARARSIPWPRWRTFAGGKACGCTPTPRTAASPW